MRAKSIVMLLLGAPFALATGACTGGSSAGSVTVAKSLNDGKVKIASITGTFTWSGYQIDGNGIICTAAEGDVINEFEWWIYNDRDGDGEFDPGEDSVYEHGTVEGEKKEVQTGRVQFTIGSNDRPPRMKVRIKTRNGKATIDTGVNPS